MRKTTRFQCAPREMFAGTATLMTATALGALALLRASAGYPAIGMTVAMLVLAVLLGAASLWYLAKSRALLRIDVNGIAHVPFGGKARRFSWEEIARLRSAPGWLSVHDHSGRQLCCYTYNHARHASLVRILADYRSMSARPAEPGRRTPRQGEADATRRAAPPAAGRRTARKPGAPGAAAAPARKRALRSA